MLLWWVRTTYLRMRRRSRKNGSIAFEVCAGALVEADSRWPENDRLHSACGFNKCNDECPLLRPNCLGRHSCRQARSLDRNKALRVAWCLGPSRRCFSGCMKQDTTIATTQTQVFGQAVKSQLVRMASAKYYGKSINDAIVCKALKA